MVARPMMSGAPNDRELLGARHRLVETLRQKGIRDLAVLRAIEMGVFVPNPGWQCQDCPFRGRCWAWR